MARLHTPLQQFKEAKEIARAHGCFVIEKGGKFLLYRAAPDKNVFLGQRGTAESLRRLVCQVTNFN